MMRFKFLLAVISLSLCHTPLAFAAQEELHVRKAHPNPGGKLLVVVELPQGLVPKASDFHLLIDNKSVATATEIRGQDIDVTLLVDISGSMKGPPINDAKAALLSLVDRAKDRPKDRFKLASFADEYRVLTELKQSRQYLIAAIRKLTATGEATKLFDALHESLGNDHDVDPDTRRVFIVISDGKDEGFKPGMEGSKPGMEPKVFDRSKDSGVPIHAVFRGQDKQFAVVLSSLAHASGGIYRPADNENKLKAALNEIYQLETRSFLVSFTYDRDPSKKETNAAAIEYRPAAGSPLRDKISVAIPLASLPVVPPVDNKRYLIVLLLSFASLLLIGAIVIWRRRETALKKENVIIDVREPESMVVPRPGHEPTPPRRVATQVISCEFPPPKPGQPTAMLIGVGGPAEGQQYSMEREIFHIGAGAENDLSIERDDYVSTQHAYLRYEKGSLFIIDQASRNGTFVNNSQVSHIGHVLRPGDRIRVGMSIFEVATPSKS